MYLSVFVLCRLVNRNSVFFLILVILEDGFPIRLKLIPEQGTTQHYRILEAYDATYAITSPSRPYKHEQPRGSASARLYPTAPPSYGAMQ